MENLTYHYRHDESWIIFIKDLKKDINDRATKI